MAQKMGTRMYYRRWFLAGLVAAATSTASVTLAADSAPGTNDINALLRRIEELEEKVRRLEEYKNVTTNAATEEHLQKLDQQVSTLERNQGAPAGVDEKKPNELPFISVGGEGFTLAAANGDFKLQLKGLLQVDSRTFFGDTGIAGNDTLLIRRMRPILQGTVFKDFDFVVVPDFGGSGSPQLFDAYINYRFNAAVQLQAGKYKPPVGLEMLQADQYTLFNERSIAADLVPNRDVGFELHGDLWQG